MKITHKELTIVPRIAVLLCGAVIALMPMLAGAATNADTNDDNYISVAEGVPFYGAIKYSLTTSGMTDADSGLALDRFPVADQNGKYSYSRTFTIDENDDPTSFHVVVHGIDIDQNGAYDGDKKSSIAPDVSFEATVPTACGIVKMNGGSGTYRANLGELNSTGATGNVTVTKDDDEVTVTMDVRGVSANLPHAQHFHMGGDGTCPPNTTGVEMSQVGSGHDAALIRQEIDLLEQLKTLLIQRIDARISRLEHLI